MNFYEITIQRISHLSINFEIITTQQQKKNQMTGMGTTKGIIFENNIIRKKMSLAEVLKGAKILLF